MSRGAGRRVGEGCRPSALVSEQRVRLDRAEPAGVGPGVQGPRHQPLQVARVEAPGVDVQQHEGRVGAEQRDRRLEEPGQVTVELPVAGRSPPEGWRIQQQRVVLASAPALAVDEAAGVLVIQRIVDTPFRAAFSRAQPIAGREASTCVTRAPAAARATDAPRCRRTGSGPPGLRVVARYVSRRRSGRQRERVDHPGPVGRLLGEQARVAGRGAADQEPEAGVVDWPSVGERPVGAPGRADPIAAPIAPILRPSKVASARDQASAPRAAGRWRGNRAAPGPLAPAFEALPAPNVAPNFAPNFGSNQARNPRSNRLPVSW